MSRPSSTVSFATITSGRTYGVVRKGGMEKGNSISRTVPFTVTYAGLSVEMRISERALSGSVMCGARSKRYVSL